MVKSNSTFINEMTSFYELEEIYDEWFSGKTISYVNNKLKETEIIGNEERKHG